jgi:hypothetical protein
MSLNSPNRVRRKHAVYLIVLHTWLICLVFLFYSQGDWYRATHLSLLHLSCSEALSIMLCKRHIFEINGRGKPEKQACREFWWFRKSCHHCPFGTRSIIIGSPVLMRRRRMTINTAKKRCRDRKMVLLAREECKHTFSLSPSPSVPALCF